MVNGPSSAALRIALDVLGLLADGPVTKFIVNLLGPVGDSTSDGDCRYQGDDAEQ